MLRAIFHAITVGLTPTGVREVAIGAYLFVALAVGAVGTHIGAQIAARRTRRRA